MCAEKVSIRADPNHLVMGRPKELSEGSETITFDEYTRFAALLENDTLYASLIIDHNADGKVYRKDLEILIQNGKHTTSTTSTSTT